MMDSRMILGVAVFDLARCLTRVKITIPKNIIFTQYENMNNAGKSREAETQSMITALTDKGRNAGCFLSEFINPNRKIRLNDRS